MNLSALVIFGLLSFVSCDYAPTKQCRQECSLNVDCKSGYICKSVGCNRLCTRIAKKVLPVEPVWPIDPFNPVNPIHPVDPLLPVDPVLPVGSITQRLSQCISRCQLSTDCNTGLCNRRMCKRICQNRIGGSFQSQPVNPIGHDIIGCRDECNSLLPCRIGESCVRSGCRNVCIPGRKGSNSYL